MTGKQEFGPPNVCKLTPQAADGIAPLGLHLIETFSLQTPEKVTELKVVYTVPTTAPSLLGTSDMESLPGTE